VNAAERKNNWRRRYDFLLQRPHGDALSHEPGGRAAFKSLQPASRSTSATPTVAEPASREIMRASIRIRARVPHHAHAGAAHGVAGRNHAGRFSLRGLLTKKRRALRSRGRIQIHQWRNSSCVPTACSATSRRRLMRVFLHAQHAGCGLNPDSAPTHPQFRSLVDREFLADAHARERFRRSLNQRGNVAPVLRMMHEVIFSEIHSRIRQAHMSGAMHSYYHQYSLTSTRSLPRTTGPRVEAKAMPTAIRALFQGVERRICLYLALLLHDVGKPTGHGQHARSARTWPPRGEAFEARRLGHTHLADVIKIICSCERFAARDLDDPIVIRNFAEVWCRPRKH